MKNFLPRLFQKPKVKTIYLYPFGEFYNLKEMLLSLNKEYFDEKLELKITWFGRGKIGRTRLLFGSYDAKLKLIKVTDEDTGDNEVYKSDGLEFIFSEFKNKLRLNIIEVK